MGKVKSNLLWLWLLILVLINVIPIGNESNKSLSCNKMLIFRLDYLVHTLMILCFAWLWMVSRVRRLSFFKQHEFIKFSGIVLATGIGLECLQLYIPWRSFNPQDMYYNIVGAILAMMFILVSKVVERGRL